MAYGGLCPALLAKAKVTEHNIGELVPGVLHEHVIELQVTVHNAIRRHLVAKVHGQHQLLKDEACDVLG